MFENDQEREHAQVRTDARESAVGVAATPGRASTSSQLMRRAKPQASGILMRKEARDSNGVAANAEEAVAAASTSSGNALPTTLQRKFEASLGVDLSNVRVHTGATSGEASLAVGAKAYTVGQDIHFGAGQYDPASRSGQHLLAHEVAHTVQQRGATPTRQNKLEVSQASDVAELEADRAADAMLAGEPAEVAGAPVSISRRADMKENALAGEREIEGAAAAAPVNQVSNVNDVASARALLDELDKTLPLVQEGIGTAQVDNSVRIANEAVSTLLGTYLQNADGHGVQISTFQGLNTRLIADFGRLNQMSKAFDGQSLAKLDEERMKNDGASKAKAIFGDDDPIKEKEAAFRVDPSLKTRYETLQGEKALLAGHGTRIHSAGNGVASALTAITRDQRTFVSKIYAVKSPAAVQALEDAKTRASYDYSGPLASVLRSAVMGGIAGAAGGPAGAAAGAAKAGASEAWNALVKPKLAEWVQHQDIAVGEFPDKSEKKAEIASDMAAWAELQNIANRISASKIDARQRIDDLGNELRVYATDRDVYLNKMIALGQDMDKAYRTSQNAGRKPPSCEEICRPGGPPPAPPGPRAKGPRFETAMQFLAEADRFIVQAALVKEHGEAELKIRPGDESQAASKAHAALKKATTDGNRPSYYYIVSVTHVPRKDMTEFRKLTAVPFAFTLHNGLNPSEGVGVPETAEFGSAEGHAGKGANDLLSRQIDAVDGMSAKVAALRHGIGEALGL